MKDKIKQLFNIENRTKYFVHMLFFLCLTSIIVFLFLIMGGKFLNQTKVVTAKEKPKVFTKVEILAKSAVVWDVINQRELFAKNPDLPLPLASLTKVMTALTAEINLAHVQNADIKQEYLKPEGDSKLIVGDTWKVSDLRDFTLLTSSNDGAFALAALSEANVKNPDPNPKAEFIKAMNTEANLIGLLNSKFFNEHGLDKGETTGGAYGSARDMASLFEYILKNHPNILEATRYSNLEFKSTTKTYPSVNTNTVINQIPGILASKTGFTDLAGGNLVIAFDAGLNRPIIISILGSTEEGRFLDTLKLVRASLKYIQNN